MMTNLESIKRTILAALDQHEGDNLQRAKHAFCDMTPEQMQQEYGYSGETRQKILDGYQRHVDACEQARAWVESQP